MKYGFGLAGLNVRVRSHLNGRDSVRWLQLVQPRPSHPVLSG
ncbi:hypothetical protein BH23GEM6_BH23GEM6_15940 [soil metagenome]